MVETKHDAELAVRQLYHDGDIVLSGEDYVDTMITVEQP